jgi:hypothetical protein
MSQYFVKVEVASYVDKNKLSTELKKSIKGYDHILLHSKEAFQGLIHEIRIDWSLNHKQFNRCKEICLDDSVKSIHLQTANTRTLGNHAIGWVRIHEVLKVRA